MFDTEKRVLDYIEGVTGVMPVSANNFEASLWEIAFDEDDANVYGQDILDGLYKSGLINTFDKIDFDDPQGEMFGYVEVDLNDVDLENW